MNKHFELHIECMLRYKYQGIEKASLNYLGGISLELGKVVPDDEFLGRRCKYSNIISMIDAIRQEYLQGVCNKAMACDMRAMHTFYIDDEYRLILPGHNSFYKYGKLGYIFNEDQKEEFDACKTLLSTERVKTEIIEMLKDRIFLDYVVEHIERMKIHPDENNDEKLDIPPAGVDGEQLGISNLSYEYRIRVSDKEHVSLNNIGVLDRSKG